MIDNGCIKYKTTGILRGPSTRDLDGMIRVLYNFTYDYSPIYFTDIFCDEISEGEVTFSADGPHGGFCGLDDMDVFRKMASAAPEMTMEASIRGCEENFSYTRTDEALFCRLDRGILTTEISYITRGQSKTYEEYIAGALPYEKYTLIFGIEPGTLAKDDYERFIDCLVFHGFDSPLDLELEEYSELLGRFNGKTTLDRRTYDAACEKAKHAGLITFPEFLDLISTVETEVRRFDARTGKYIG